MKDTSSSVGSGSAADAERMQVLEIANAKLATHVHKLEVEHAFLAHASDIVIGGLRFLQIVTMNLQRLLS